MADRHPFGGSLPDWIFTKNADDIPVFSGGAVLQLWNQRDGGTQYTDITEDAEGTVPITTLLSSDGTGGYELGAIPEFYGPPGITSMWISADGGLRRALGARDSAQLAGDASAGLAQHVSQQNPHSTTLTTLADTAFSSTIADGSLVAWDTASGKFVDISGSGLNPADFVKTAGGSTIRIPDGNVVDFAQVIRLPALRTSAPDAFSVYWNSGTNGAPVWLQVFWMASTGEPRVQASADNRVALKVQRRSTGATADQQQWLNEAGTPLSWITAKGSLRAPNVGRSVSFTKAGTVTTGVGKFAWVNATGVDVVLRALWFKLNTAGTGTSTFDVNMNGTTLYPSGKPTIASGATTSGIIAAALTITAGAVITVDVDAIAAGSEDLTCQLEIV